jgi:Fe-S-cluster-containing dehydrogenase component
MGSSMAENHPVGFQWVIEARERGAKVIHVDPRFTRTSAMADIWVPLRAGSDVLFLGGLINYVLEHGKEFREYVAAYTNASTLLRHDFLDTEDLDGLFSGWDAVMKKYDPESWAHRGSPSTNDKDALSSWGFSSDVCKHCEHAGCLEACPTGSIVQTEFGSVYIQPDICNGCGYCVVSCPFGVVERNNDDGRAFKCTFCYDRQKAGLVPACAKACPTESIKFGEIGELQARAQGANSGTAASRNARRHALRCRGQQCRRDSCDVHPAGRSAQLQSPPSAGGADGSFAQGVDVVGAGRGVTAGWECAGISGIARKGLTNHVGPDVPSGRANAVGVSGRHSTHGRVEHPCVAVTGSTNRDGSKRNGRQ